MSLFQIYAARQINDRSVQMFLDRASEPHGRAVNPLIWAKLGQIACIAVQSAYAGLSRQRGLRL